MSAKQEDCCHQSTCGEAQVLPEPALGKALFRVMRAILHDDKPPPELDALPLAQLRLLWSVLHETGATMKEYSERLRVTRSTVTQLAERLVRRGLIERFHDTTDRRIVRLRLSPAGRRLMNAADRTRRETLQGVWEELSGPERERVLASLHILARTAETVRQRQGRPVTPWPGCDIEDSAVKDRTEPAQPLMDILSRRVRGNTP